MFRKETSFPANPFMPTINDSALPRWRGMMSNTPATVMPALRQTQHMDKVRTAVACHMPIDSYECCRYSRTNQNGRWLVRCVEEVPWPVAIETWGLIKDHYYEDAAGVILQDKSWLPLSLGNLRAFDSRALRVLVDESLVRRCWSEAKTSEAK